MGRQAMQVTGLWHRTLPTPNLNTQLHNLNRLKRKLKINTIQWKGNRPKDWRIDSSICQFENFWVGIYNKKKIKINILMYHRHFRAQIQSSGKINVSGSLTHQRIHTPSFRPVQLTLIWFRISTLTKLFTTFGAFASFIRKVRCIKTRLDTRLPKSRAGGQGQWGNMIQAFGQEQ